VFDANRRFFLVLRVSFTLLLFLSPHENDKQIRLKRKLEVKAADGFHPCTQPLPTATATATPIILPLPPMPVVVVVVIVVQRLQCLPAQPSKTFPAP
jgi:hypothetical protein